MSLPQDISNAARDKGAGMILQAGVCPTMGRRNAATNVVNPNMGGGRAGATSTPARTLPYQDKESAEAGQPRW